MSNTYITIVDGEYKKAKAPDVPQPWKPKGGESSGGGLPDPSSYEDGTVLIKVGGEWKAQSGYGYESDGAVHTIDPKFIPQSGNEFVVNFSMNGGGTVTADKTPTEVMQAYSLGKHCIGIFGANHFTFDGGMFQLILFDEGELSVAIFGALDMENWQFVEASYTLTPAE